MAKKPTTGRPGASQAKAGAKGARSRASAQAPAAAPLAGLPGVMNPDRWPAAAVERWEVAKLVPYARNARTHSADQVAEIARSIETFGWTIPVLVDELGMIIAGHGRVLAAAKLGLATVPVMIARGWTSEQKRAYTIADNKIGLNAGWDLEILRTELVDLGGAGIDPGLLGFSGLELNDLMAGTPNERDPEATPEPPKNPVSKRGDIWLLGAQVRCPKCKKFTPLHEALKRPSRAKPAQKVTA